MSKLPSGELVTVSGKALVIYIFNQKLLLPLQRFQDYLEENAECPQRQ